MRMPVRTKLFLSIGGLILFFVLFSLLMNWQYLDKYYFWQKKQVLLESKNTIDAIYQGDPAAIAFELEGLERNRGMNIYLITDDYLLKYNSSLRIYNPERSPVPDFSRRISDRLALLGTIEPRFKQLRAGDYIFDEVTDPRLNTNFLVLTSRLRNNEVMVLTTPLVAINESTEIANTFFLLTGLITVIIGGLAVFIFSKKFTQPILELNNIALKMTKLDFSHKYPVESDDELGQLGKSINSLSDQLGQAISELTEANDKLKQDIEHERQLEKMRKEFVSSVSHELKTPTALIQGYAEGLKLNVNEDEENKNFYCEVIIDETNKMSNLIKELLELSQYESGSFKLARSVFNFSALVNYVLDKYRPLFRERDIQLDFKSNENLFVDADVVRIEQVLVNYLSNAINHVDDNRLIQVIIEPRNNKIRVSVYNSGPQIPDGSLDKIWTSFYKVDKARTRSYGGTGLGLSVVRAIMDLHHGAYGVQNTANGVSFWFELDKSTEGEGDVALSL